MYGNCIKYIYIVLSIYIYLQNYFTFTQYKNFLSFIHKKKIRLFLQFLYIISFLTPFIFKKIYFFIFKLFHK